MAAECSALNHAEPFTLAVPVDLEEAVERETMEETEITETLLLGTDDWVKALRYDDGWRVVESVELEDPVERFEAMQVCRAALREA